LGLSKPRCKKCSGVQAILIFFPISLRKRNGRKFRSMNPARRRNPESGKNARNRKPACYGRFSQVNSLISHTRHRLSKSREIRKLCKLASAQSVRFREGGKPEGLSNRSYEVMNSQVREEFSESPVPLGPRSRSDHEVGTDKAEVV